MSAPTAYARSFKRSTFATIFGVALALVLGIGPDARSQTTTYTYDALGRLTGSSTTGGNNDGLQSTTTFDPAGNRTGYSVSGSQGSARTVSFSVGDASATEGGTLVFTITKSGTTGATVTLNYASADGSAIAGSDYNAASGTLTFAPSETSKTVSVTTIDDTVNEPTETMSLNLSSPSNGASLTRGSGTGTIADNDAPPSISVADATATEGGALSFVVTKFGATSQSVSVNFATANGSAIAGTNYNSTSGTLTFAPNETSKTITVSTIDDAIYAPTETMTLNLSSPTIGATLSRASATGSIKDNDGPPAISVADATVTEGGALSFVVTKTGATSQSVSVNYATADGSAVAGSDYNATSGTLTFAPNETSKTITVSTIDDAIYELTETMALNLSSPTNGASLSRASATGTINDNDAFPALSISDATVTEGGTLVFTVSKSSATSQTVSVNFATSNGSAIAGSDYNASSGTLTFTPSETSKTIAVTTIDDSVNEPTETMSVQLSSASGATINRATATGMINDNDAAPSFAIGDAGTVARGGTLVFPVTKSGATTQSFSVNFASANGTASAGTDYNATSGTLTFAPGDTSQSVSVSTIGDAATHPALTLSVQLSGASGGSSISGSSGGGTIAAQTSPYPIANPDNATAGTCAVTYINVTANDTDPGGNYPLTVTAVSPASGGSVNIVSASTIAYHGGNVPANDTITYTIKNTLGYTATSYVDVAIRDRGGCN